MLTAWDPVAATPLALPDHETGAELELVRTRTRAGELVCPTCRQKLWLRAGEVVIPHFAHRRLSDCPHGRVSETVLGARRLLYRFFQSRIERGKLEGEIELEPVWAGLPDGTQVDLLLRRRTRPAVQVILIERGLRPEARGGLRCALEVAGCVFRPVFLRQRLHEATDKAGRFLLEPTQREFRIPSVYDLAFPGTGWPGGSLHFIDPPARTWTTLRGLALAHPPQVYRAAHCRLSSMEQLLWSEAHADWVHPGEPGDLKRHREKLAALERRAAETDRRRNPPQPAWSPAPTAVPAPPPEEQGEAAAPVGDPVPSPQPVPGTPPVCAELPPPLPAWITQGLLCIGCGQRTTAWQTAAPEQDQCVCRTCFRAGVRQR